MKLSVICDNSCTLVSIHGLNTQPDISQLVCMLFSDACQCGVWFLPCSAYPAIFSIICGVLVEELNINEKFASFKINF